MEQQGTVGQGSATRPMAPTPKVEKKIEKSDKKKSSPAEREPVQHRPVQYKRESPARAGLFALTVVAEFVHCGVIPAALAACRIWS
jgi:hypothetical protein